MRTVIIVLAVISLLAVFLFVPVRVKVYLQYENSALRHGYIIKYGPLTLKNSEDKKRKKPEKTHDKMGGKPKPKNNPVKMIKFLTSNIADIKRLVTSVARYITKRAARIEKLSIDAKLGTDDAMQTGLIYGGFSAFLYSILSGLDRCTKMRGVSVNSEPDFTKPQIFIKIESIIKTTAYNIVAIAVLALFGAMPLLKKRGELKNGKSD